MAEERDASNSVTKRFLAQGEQISGTKYYYARDHLGSIREMVDNSGTIQARYDYDPYGRVTKISGSLDSDFQYAGYYEHAVSALNLTLFRAYDSNAGKWLSRDPIGEVAGTNQYQYCGNNSLTYTDMLGMVRNSLISPSAADIQDTIDQLSDSTGAILDALNSITNQEDALNKDINTDMIESLIGVSEDGLELGIDGTGLVTKVGGEGTSVLAGLQGIERDILDAEKSQLAKDESALAALEYQEDILNQLLLSDAKILRDLNNRLKACK